MDQTLPELQETLDNYIKQRQSVLLVQANDPHNETINKLLSDLDEAIKLTEDLINIKRQQEHHERINQENEEQVQTEEPEKGNLNLKINSL